ncbi:MAG: hypothetical protein ACQESG_05955 [Nanobdellota archaeon]
MGSKGNVGIGTLVLFITILMVSAIAVIVMIQTSGVITQDSRKAGDQTKKEISTGININEIILEKDQQGEYTRIMQTIKLLPGSDLIKLNDTIIMISLDDSTAHLSFNANQVTENSPQGYMTRSTQAIEPLGFYHVQATNSIELTSWTSLEQVDLDLDGSTDFVKLCNNEAYCNSNQGGYLVFNLSSDGFVLTQLLNESGDAMNPATGQGGQADIDQPIGTYGRMRINGSMCNNCGSLSVADLDMHFYNNRATLENDLDNDQDGNDYLHINNTHAIFNFSSGLQIPIPFGDISTAPAVVDVSTELATPNSATITITGTTDTDYVLGEEITFQIVPQNSNGYFIADYLKTGREYSHGILGPQDIVTLYMETPKSIESEEDIKISIIPSNGATFTKEVATKDSLQDKSISLYP